MADHKPARVSKRHAPATGGGAGRARRAARKPSRHPRLSKFFRGLLIAILSLVLIAGVGVFVAYERTELPDP
ncbi:hypothetical protein GUG52_24675, partial [Xanthomonas citri pv. citri]|nr:hypothetical protein [Xanthomonas citri pv. citri]